MYLGLLSEGWKIQDIDQTPIRRYTDLIAYKLEKTEIEQIKALDDAGL